MSNIKKRSRIPIRDKGRERIIKIALILLMSTPLIFLKNTITGYAIGGLTTTYFAKFFSVPSIILYALLYGTTMKIADLLDEHGLKWFKGSNIFFGFLWGIFGALLVLSSNSIANIILAMNLAFIIRNRLDYVNHQIATSIIIMSFLFSSVFNPLLFLFFYAIFLIFGSLRDYAGDKVKKKSFLSSLYDNVMWYYPIPTLIYCYFYGNWNVFWVFLVYTIAYDGTKYIYKNKGYY